MSDRNNLFTNDCVASSRIIYTPSAFARSSLFYLQETGTLRAIRPHVSSRVNLQSYLFLIVLDGEGWLEYNGVHYDLSKDCAVFIDCRKGYRQSSGDRLWRLKWCHFHSSNMSAVYNKWTERGGKPVFRPSDSAIFVEALDRLYVTASGEDFVRDMHINEQLVRLTTLLMEQTVYEERRGCKDRKQGGRQSSKQGIKQTVRPAGIPDLKEFDRQGNIKDVKEFSKQGNIEDVKKFSKQGGIEGVNELSKQAGRQSVTQVGKPGSIQDEEDIFGWEVSGASRANVEEVKSCIDTHYREALSLEGIAAQFFVNKNYLARVFKETYGVTVGNYIQMVRIGKAKELLRFSGMTVEQISYECGYGGDSNYFSRVFKKVEGCSPREFRKIWMSE